jgi:glycosyltransferase involved in cell wall biosynthesis
LKRVAALLAPDKFRSRNPDETPSLLPFLSAKRWWNRSHCSALARGLAGYAPAGSRNAFDVTVVTETPAGNYPDADLSFRVVRRPSIFQLRKLIDTADVVHVAGAALPPMFWGLWLNKPVIVEHHGYHAICPTGMLLKLPELPVCPGYFRQRKYAKGLQCLAQESGWLRAWARLLWHFPRLWLTRRVAANIAISHHEEQRIDLPLTSVIYHGIAAPPPADNASPTVPSPSQKTHFAFLGRLVAEKGALILVAAANTLRAQRRDFFLSIIGDGPERPRVEQAIQSAKLQDYVRVLGVLRGDELARALPSRRHALYLGGDRGSLRNREHDARACCDRSGHRRLAGND